MKSNLNLDYKRPIMIEKGVYWVGFYDEDSSLHCNPYLIVDEDEAVVLDAGSRPHFPTVMMKIMQIGIDPSSIKAIVYHHYDPDLVGSISNFEDIISNDDLKIISDAANNMFIRHYSVSSPLYSLASVRHKYKFKSGRELLFYNTPYCHSQGSFITYDTETEVLFTSDLYGSYDVSWKLFTEIRPECKECKDSDNCILDLKLSSCPVNGILKFHENIMPSTKALRNSLDVIKEIPAKVIAPQHGSILTSEEDIKFVTDRLYADEYIGIDRLVKK